LLEFEELLNNWHTIQRFSTVHGNFALVDNDGGAAMYEVYAPIQGARVRWEKFDANSAVDDRGNFIGFVVRTMIINGHHTLVELQEKKEQMKF